jgi:hypothetical protein
VYRGPAALVRGPRAAPGGAWAVPGGRQAVAPGARSVGRWPCLVRPGAWSVGRDPCALVRDLVAELRGLVRLVACDLVRDPWRVRPGGPRPWRVRLVARPRPRVPGRRGPDPRPRPRAQKTGRVACCAGFCPISHCQWCPKQFSGFLFHVKHPLGKRAPFD